MEKIMHDRVRTKRTRTRFAPTPGAPTVELTRVSGDEKELLEHRALLNTIATLDFTYPIERFAGWGIVICGGGVKYFPCVYVLVRMLRHLGCALPVEVWHLGEREMSRGHWERFEGMPVSRRAVQWNSRILNEKT